MKNNYQSYLYFIISVILTSFLWENINLPFNIEKKDLIGSYSDTFQNPLNDIVRFIIFLFIPFLTLIIFYFKNGENFLSNIKEITYFNNSKVINHKSYELRFYFWFILVILIIEFFSLNFAKMNYEVDFFHEGMWLSASQNTKFSNDFWLSSYIVRGLFGDFYPFFLWKYFDIESIGITRFFNVLILFFNKVLLLLIALKLTLISNLRKDTQIIYFLSLSVTFLCLQGYGAPIFTPRSFLLLLFIYIFLNFLHFYHKSFLYVSLIGLFSSLSFSVY